MITAQTATSTGTILRFFWLPVFQSNIGAPSVVCAAVCNSAAPFRNHPDCRQPWLTAQDDGTSI